MQLCRRLYSVSEELLDLEGATQEVYQPLVDTIGQEQDRVGFVIKRLLHLAAEKPENLIPLNIQEISQIHYYGAIGERLERLGDLYEQIFANLSKKTLDTITTNERKLFSGFLSDGFDYVEKAYQSKDFESSITLREKKEGLQKKGELVLEKIGEKPLKGGHLDLYMNVLLNEGIIGLASNILEDWAKIYCPESDLGARNVTVTRNAEAAAST